MNPTAILGFLGALCAGTLALGVLLRRPRTVAHWSFMIGMAVLAAECVLSSLAAAAPTLNVKAEWETWRMMTMSLLPCVWVLFSLSYARGSFRQLFSRWQLQLLATGCVPVAVAVIFRDELIDYIGLPTPTSTGLLGLGSPGTLLNLMLLLSAVVVLMNLERTYRAAVGTMRWRIKFMLLGVGVLFAVRAYTSSQFLLFRSVRFSLEALNSGTLIVACLLILRSILRSGHFEVSVYPSQSVLHSSFTMVLAGIYLVIVGALAKLVTFFGEADFELKAFLVLLALVLLTLILLSDRVRLWSKRFISRNFQRPIYDYRTVWRNFTDGTARQVEQPELCRAVVTLVSEIFQALAVTIWLVDEKKEKFIFAASTSLFPEKGGRLALELSETKEVIAALSRNADVIDLDSSKEAWAEALKRAHPDQFRKGGNRVCAPMMVGGEMFGLLVLCDRVGGVPFILQDFELLKCIADQAAASLLNIQLAQKLLQAKQFEAFQAMSAFFVHDLKNTASTLSLMLQNLPLHYQDPQFREDALRGVSKTVSHINELISRLAELRQELSVQAVECDLNALVSETLKGQEQPADIEVVADLHSLPKLRLDPAQIKKVLTNLVINAREAIVSGGRILVETRQSNGWAVLAVADTGCGMSAEFIQRSLFRPFQTTKKKGIGIGMFHCRMIVEAHRGRIEVDSHVGKGTTFHVLLPISGEHSPVVSPTAIGRDSSPTPASGTPR